MRKGRGGRGEADYGGRSERSRFPELRLVAASNCQPGSFNIHKPSRQPRITNSTTLLSQTLYHNPPLYHKSPNSPPCPTAKSSSLTRTSPRRLTNRSPKLNSLLKYAGTPIPSESKLISLVKRPRCDREAHSVGEANQTSKDQSTQP